MTMWFTIRLVLVSLLAIPVCIVLNATSHSPGGLFVLALVVIAAVVPSISYFALFSSSGRSWANLYCYVFTLFAFTSVVDGLLGLTIHGWLDVLKFYLLAGEPYLNTSHGLFINYWDATFHYACYVALVSGYRYSALNAPSGAKPSYPRQVALLWFGSIMNSLVVFLPGNVVGRFSDHIKPSYLLNVPFVLFPITFLFQEIYRVTHGASPAPGRRESRSTASMAVLTFVVVFSGVASVVIFTTRALSVLSLDHATWIDVEPYLLDTTQYPRLQVLTHSFYGIPFVVGILMRWVLSKDWYTTWWVMDGSSMFLGAMLQSQFTHVGASLVDVSRTSCGVSFTWPFLWKPPPGETMGLFWVANVMPVVFAASLWSACHIMPSWWKRGGKEKNE